MTPEELFIELDIDTEEKRERFRQLEDLQNLGKPMAFNIHTPDNGRTVGTCPNCEVVASSEDGVVDSAGRVWHRTCAANQLSVLKAREIAPLPPIHTNPGETWLTCQFCYNIVRKGYWHQCLPPPPTTTGQAPGS